jgi:hypothetical protein
LSGRAVCAIKLPQLRQRRSVEVAKCGDEVGRKRAIEEAYPAVVVALDPARADLVVEDRAQFAGTRGSLTELVDVDPARRMVAASLVSI